MSDRLTCVQIEFYPEFANHWLRFGEPDHWLDLDRRRALAAFKPGRLFGYVRWRANEYGTQVWRFTIAQSATPSVPLTRVEGVDPGGEVLLRVTGKAKVTRALVQIDVLEAAGFEPAQASLSYYRHVQNQLATGRPIHAYGEAQHAAYMAGRKVAS